MSYKRRPLMSRRTALAQAAGAAGLASIFKMTEDRAAAQARGGAAGQAGGARGGAGGMRGGSNVRYGAINKYSSPSDLRITDLRAITIAANFDSNIIRMDTNQGVYGLGEGTGVLKGIADAKSLVVGRNPLDITAILANLRTSAAHSAMSVLDMCLHDLNAKVFGIPMWRLLGDKKRDRIRIYCDTTGTPNFKTYAERMLKRKQQGFTFFKMDITDNWIDGNRPGSYNSQGVITDKGLAYAGELLQAVRDAIGWDVPLAVDASSGYRRVPGAGYPELPVPDAIRTARAYEKYDLAWVEDLYGASAKTTPWQRYAAVKAASTAKLLTGETAFGLEEFKPLIDNRAIDVVAPDPVRCGGLREMKRICDYAHDNAGMPSAIHMLGTPVMGFATAHALATISNLLSMECHAVDHLVWWTQLVTGVSQPIIDKGYMTVPDSPGLGVELNEAVLKEHLRTPGWFESVTEAMAAPRTGPRGGVAALRRRWQLDNRIHRKLLSRLTRGLRWRCEYMSNANDATYGIANELLGNLASVFGEQFECAGEVTVWAC